MIGSLVPLVGAETLIWRGARRPGAGMIKGLTVTTGVAVVIGMFLASPIKA